MRRSKGSESISSPPSFFSCFFCGVVKFSAISPNISSRQNTIASFCFFSVEKTACNRTNNILAQIHLPRKIRNLYHYLTTKDFVAADAAGAKMSCWPKYQYGAMDFRWGARFLPTCFPKTARAPWQTSLTFLESSTANFEYSLGQYWSTSLHKSSVFWVNRSVSSANACKRQYYYF